MPCTHSTSSARVSPRKRREAAMRFEECLLNDVRRTDLHLQLSVQLLLSADPQIGPQPLKDLAERFAVALLGRGNANLPAGG